MNSDLRELYQDTVLAHSRHPHNKGKVANATASAYGHNPLCGDSVALTLREEDGRIVEVRFEGEGCAISTASASMMTEAVMGKSREEAEQILERFQDLITSVDSRGSSDDPESHEDELLGELMVFAGVREFPVRIKCATLPWHALKAALGSGSRDVTSE